MNRLMEECSKLFNDLIWDKVKLRIKQKYNVDVYLIGTKICAPEGVSIPEEEIEEIVNDIIMEELKKYTY